MDVSTEDIKRALTEAERPLSVTELQSRLGVHPSERTNLKRLLRELYRDGLLHKAASRYSLPGQKPKGNAPPAVEDDADGEGEEKAVEEARPSRFARKEPRQFEPPARHAKGKPERQPPPKRKGPRRAEETEGTQPPLLLQTEEMSHKGRFVVGILQRHREGYGFLQPLTGGRGDVFIPPGEADQALDGDVIRVEMVPGRGGKQAGRFVEIVERRRNFAVGTYVHRGRASFVIPVDKSMPASIFVDPAHEAEDGDLVKVRITGEPGAAESPTGTIAEVLGKPGDPIAAVLDAAYAQGFADEFPADVVAEARDIPTEVKPEEIARRRDLRELKLVTIDGEDARDFDDAVYVERTRTGYRLVVAIADVAHYVRHRHPLDNEALRRATSVYFPNRVLPMLPERLSNGICSLNPEVDRLCMVADMIWEPEGDSARIANAEIYEAVMKSTARCTYTEVATVLSGEKVSHREFLRPDFELMEELARRLMSMRQERGAIDFDLPESRAVLDDRMMPIKIAKRERNIAHRIVEEFMLAANEAVAKYFSVRDLPTVYRIHGEPDEEKLENFLALARAHGFSLEKGEEIDGKALNALLKKIAGTPEQKTLNFMMLRAMMQAVYSPENIGHFGLAAPFYLHFTSPIRRYPDLMVHRLLKEHWARGARTLMDVELDKQQLSLDAVAARSSERERAAMKAEREVDNYFAALYMRDKVGEEFDGTIAAVTDFGAFVELDEENVEGLVKAEGVGHDAQFDETKLELRFAGGRKLKVGDAMRVRVVNVSIDRRQIEFAAVRLADGTVIAPPEPVRPPRQPWERDFEAGGPGEGEQGAANRRSLLQAIDARRKGGGRQGGGGRQESGGRGGPPKRGGGGGGGRHGGGKDRGGRSGGRGGGGRRGR